MATNLAPFHVEVINSKQDVNGNRYWGIVITRLGGETTVGTISGDESNVRAALCELFGGWDEMRNCCFVSQSERSKLDFNRIFDDASYAGCTNDQIGPFIAAFVKGGA